jgi:two-component system sensor histidine kinase CpxA
MSPRFELLVPTHVLLLRLLAVVLAAGFGCYLLARYLTSPVRQLQDAARKLAAGDLSTRVGQRLRTRGDEIGQLGRDFDRMAGRVETLLTTQRRLLQDVSHELRSPLARLNVALELAARDAGPAATPALPRVAREADRLNELIGQLLTLARLEAGTAHPQHQPFDFATLVQEVVEDAEFEAGARDRHVRASRLDACTVIGEASLLRSAVENIVRNAVHHTAAESTVEVTLIASCETAPSDTVLEVRDHGPGVPEESLQAIFEPFYRVSDARDRKSGGTGLGLAIAQRAIRLHHGTVTARNADDGGLLVRITLPRALPPS